MANIFDGTFVDVAAVEAIADYQHNLVGGDFVTDGDGLTGVNITGSKYLRYPTLNNFNFEKGAVQIKYRPNWDLTVSQGNKYLFDVDWSTTPTTQKLQLWMTNGPAQARIYFYGITFPTGLPNTFEPQGLQSGSSTSANLFELYWDFSSVNFVIIRTGCKYHGINWVTSPTVNSIAAGSLLRIGSTGSNIFDGIIYSFKVWDNPTDLLPVPLAEFPGFGASVNGQVNGPSANVVVDDSSYLTAGMMVQVALDIGRLNTTVAAVTDGTNIVLTDGVPAGRHIDDNATISTNAYNPWFPATEANVRALFPDGDGICAPWETNATNPLDCPLLGAGIHVGENVLFFRSDSYKPVYEGYVPTEAEIDDDFIWKVAPGETETLVFNIYTRAALANVAVDCSAGGFTGPGTIAKSFVDIRIVKNWWQSTDTGSSGIEPIPTWVCDLMVHDDTIATDTDQTIGQNWNQLVPEMPLADHVTKANIAINTARQFVLEVKVPANAVAGNYTTTVTITADGGVSVNKTFTITVLPFVLQDFDYLRSIWYEHGKVYVTAASYSIDDWDVIDTHLNYIRDMGYNFLCLNVCDGGTTEIPSINTYIDHIAAAGFDGLAIYGANSAKYTYYATRFSQAVIDYAAGVEATTGMRIFFMMTQEFDHGWTVGGTPTTDGKWQILFAKWIHSLGGKVFATADRITSGVPVGMNDYISRLEEFSPANYTGLGDIEGDASIDMVDVNYSARLYTVPPIQAHNATMEEGVYWQLRDGLTRLHRWQPGYAGALGGIRPGSAESNTNYTAWNDFNGTSAAYGILYPSVDTETPQEFHIIPCHNTMLHREGIRDCKYLATWHYYYNRIKVSHPTEAAASYEVLYNSSTGVLPKYMWNGSNAKPSVRVSYAQWDTDREAIINEILALKSLDPTTHRSVINLASTNMWKRFRKIAGVIQ